MMFPPILIAALAASWAWPAAMTDVATEFRIQDVGPAAPGQDTAFAALERRIRERIARDSGVEVSVVLIETGGARRRLGIADTVMMHAASTMKVPIMLEMFRQADQGRFTVDAPVRARNTFRSIADGSPFTLASDRDRGLIDSLGLTMPMRRIAHSMITQSSNLATNIMIEEVSADSVQKTMRLIGADGMRVLRGVSDNVAFGKGLNNTTTAAALARVMEVIDRCDLGQSFPAPGLTRASCDEMFRMLSEQRFRTLIPAGLPVGTTVGNKTGNITAISHDAAIVRPPGRGGYVLVVLTRGYSSVGASAPVVSDISRLVWEVLAGRGDDPPAPRGRMPEAR